MKGAPTTRGASGLTTLRWLRPTRIPIAEAVSRLALVLASCLYDGVRRACRVQGKRPEQALRAVMADTQLLEVALAGLVYAPSGPKDKRHDLHLMASALQYALQLCVLLLCLLQLCMVPGVCAVAHLHHSDLLASRDRLLLPLGVHDPPLAGLPARALGRGLFSRATNLRPWRTLFNEQYVWSQLGALSCTAWEVAVTQHAGRDALAPNLQAVQFVCSSYVSVGLSRAPGACVNGSQYLPASLVVPQDVER